MLARSFLALGACLLLAAAACPRAGGSAPAQPDAHDGILFEYDSGEVHLRDANGELASNRAEAVPYKIIRDSKPAIVTTCGPQLIPVTYVLGDDNLRFDNMLPQLAEPPVIALFALSTEEDTPGGRAVLIGPGGEIVWEHLNAMILLPSTGDAAQAPVLAVPCADSYETPFGEHPELIAIDPQTGAEAWRADIPVLGPPDNVELLCRSGGYGLLSLQYGYIMFQFVTLKFGTGEMRQLYVLNGQPAVFIEQPGAMPVYRHCSAEGTIAELMVNDQEREAAGILTFDLAQGTAQFSAQKITGPLAREDNVLPLGGGLASPDAPPYPQSILPTEYGEHWTIPALVIGRRFLLVTADGASWVKFAANPAASP